MNTYKVKLYKFNELNQDAKNAIIERERYTEYGFGYLQQETNAEERIATLDAFCDTFGITYSLHYDHDRRFINWQFNWKAYLENEDAEGKYLLRFLNNHFYSINKRKRYYKGNKSRKSNITYIDGPECPFTGVCYDSDILYKIFDWYKSPDWNTSIHDFFEDILCTYLDMWEKEDEWCMSDESLQEAIEANWEDKLWFEDGTEFNGNYNKLEIAA